MFIFHFDGGSSLKRPQEHCVSVFFLGGGGGGGQCWCMCVGGVYNVSVCGWGGEVSRPLSLLSHYPPPPPPHSLSLCLTAPHLQHLSLAWADGLVQFFSFCSFVLFVLVWLLGQNGPNVTVLEYGCLHILFLRTVCVGLAVRSKWTKCCCMDVCTFSFSVRFVLVWLLGQNGPNVTVLEYGCLHILFLRTVCVGLAVRSKWTKCYCPWVWMFAQSLSPYSSCCARWHCSTL